MFAINNNIERQIISDFINNSENTMRAVVSASVGKILLRLFETYFSDGIIDIYYETCIQQIRQAAGENLVKKNALDFICAIVNKPANELDTFTIYDPSQKNVLQTYQIPLKQVLILIWYAINDKKAYSHHINETDDPIKQAKEDQSHRIDTFFETIIRLQQKPVCHHGIRNDLVFMLNHTYKDVEIIEDANVAIYAYVKEKLFNAFHHAYQNKHNDQAQLKAKLLIWMKENHPSFLIDAIDPSLRHELTNGLQALFIHHGTDPSNKMICHAIEQGLNELPFSCNTKHYPTFEWINSLFNGVMVEDNTQANHALNVIQEWIEANYNFNDKTQHNVLANFYNIYQMHKDLVRYNLLLKISGKLTDDVLVIIKTKEWYFSEWEKNKVDILTNNKGFPVISEETIVQIENVSRIIHAIKNDKFIPVIENFFTQWYLAEYEYDKKTKYALYNDILLNDDVRKKINMSDREIEHFISHTHDCVKDISPYEINRIFLHAIINDPSHWSPLFFNAFSHVLAFVENKFNHDSNYLAKALESSAYPYRLRAQLKYLKHRYDVLVNNEPPSDDIPRIMSILLPNQIRTVNDWNFLADILQVNPKHCTSIYHAIKAHLKPILLKAIDEDNLFEMLRRIPESCVDEFLILAYKTSKSIVESYPLSLIVKHISKQNRIVFIKLLDNYALKTVIKELSPLAILKLLETEHQIEFIKWLGDSGMLTVTIHDSSTLGRIFANVAEPVQIALIHALGRRGLENIIYVDRYDIYEFDEAYCHIFSKACVNAKVILVKTLGIRNVWQLGNLLQSMDLDSVDQATVIQSLKPDTLKNMIENTYQLTHVFQFLDNTNWDTLLQLLSKDKVKALLSDISLVNHALTIHPWYHQPFIEFVNKHELIDKNQTIQPPSILAIKSKLKNVVDKYNTLMKQIFTHFFNYFSPGFSDEANIKIGVLQCEIQAIVNFAINNGYQRKAVRQLIEDKSLGCNTLINHDCGNNLNFHVKEEIDQLLNEDIKSLSIGKNG